MYYFVHRTIILHFTIHYVIILRHTTHTNHSLWSLFCRCN